MDRWEDRDGDDLGDDDDKGPARTKRRGLPGLRSVTRQGLSGFVTSEAPGPAPSPAARAQPASEATVVMPSKQALSKLPGNFSAPTWAAVTVPKGASLDVRKNGASIMRIHLLKGVTVLGRHPDADISLDHASVSRFHAALVFDTKGQLMCKDNISAHGTFVNGKQLKQGSSCPVPDGASIRFGASTRSYTFERGSTSSGHHEPSAAGSKRPRVQFSAEEEVLGSASGKGVIGPKPAEGGETGAFQNAVKTLTIPDTNDSPLPPQKDANKAATTPKLKALMSDLKKASSNKKSSHQHAMLPSPSSAEAAAASGSSVKLASKSNDPPSRPSKALYDSLP